MWNTSHCVKKFCFRLSIKCSNTSIRLAFVWLWLPRININSCFISFLLRFSLPAFSRDFGIRQCRCGETVVLNFIYLISLFIVAAAAAATIVVVLFVLVFIFLSLVLKTIETWHIDNVKWEHRWFILKVNQLTQQQQPEKLHRIK